MKICFASQPIVLNGRRLKDWVLTSCLCDVIISTGVYKVICFVRHDVNYIQASSLM